MDGRWARRGGDRRLRWRERELHPPPASFQVDHRTSASLSLLCNLTDPSALATAAIEHSVSQSVLIRAGAYLPVGREPDPAAYATASRGLRTEYGSGGFGAFGQLGVYLP